MSLVTQINNLATAVGTKVKDLYTKVGTLTSLTTTAKTDLVSAINEVKALASSSAGATISDSSASTTTAFSSQKVTDLLASQKAAILGGASAAYDTLQELQTEIAGNQSGVASMVSDIGTKVSYTVAQSLTGVQQTQALNNIAAQSAAGIGDVTTDFVVIFNAALV